MTLCIAALSSKSCVVCADRRITSGKRTENEEHDKTIVVFADDGKAVATFSGLAQIRHRFDTHKWLLATIETLGVSGVPQYTLAGVINGLNAALTHEFQTNPDIQKLPRASRRLSVMMAGYVFQNGRGVPLIASTSNFERPVDRIVLPEAEDAFTLQHGIIQGEASIVGFVGNGAALWPGQLKKITEASLRASPKAMARALLDQIRRASDDKRSLDLIGKQVTSVHISPDPSHGVITDYHTAVVRRDVALPAAAWATRQAPGFVTDIRVGPEDADTPDLAVPQVNKKKRRRR
ncbi:hypothetical protein [Bradyrhizobium sp. 150]|uniref:hypothetical protein n=1 Tax=Bradyrhizobium sp. 150 TaxID=2782625 RepID=UPI001FF93C1B|nr:hypothetical protein [Bradyrhizobium sp. 150]MCK1676639.1 hypothetical protein [Bradyrhizobium sp. 150]